MKELRYKNTDAWSAATDLGQYCSPQNVCPKPLPSGFSRLPVYDSFEFHPIKAKCRIAAVPYYDDLQLGTPTSSYNYIGMSFVFLGDGMSGGAGTTLLPSPKDGKCTDIDNRLETPSLCNSYQTLVVGDYQPSVTCPHFGSVSRTNDTAWWTGEKLYTPAARNRSCEDTASVPQQGLYYCVYEISNDRTMDDIKDVVANIGDQNPRSQLTLEQVRGLVLRGILTNVCKSFCDDVYATDKTPQGHSKFMQTNYFSSMEGYKKEFLDVWRSLALPPALGSLNTFLDETVLRCLIFPEFKIEGGDAFVYLPVLTPLLLQELETTNDNPSPNLTYEQLTDVVHRFLGDKLSSYKSSVVPVSPAFGPSDVALDDNNRSEYTIFVDLKNLIVYNHDMTSYFPNASNPARSISSVLKDGSPGATSIVGTRDLFIVGRVYKCRVTQYSATLFYLLWNANNKNGGAISCNTLMDNVGGLTRDCFSRCSTDRFEPCENYQDQCCQILLRKFCDPDPTTQNVQNDVNFPGLTTDILDTLYVMPTSNIGACECYNTQLSPPKDTDKNHRAAMCFTNACTTDEGIVKGMHLTEEDCQQYCPTVSAWLISPKTDERTRHRYYLDQDRFNRLCAAPVGSGPAFSFRAFFISLALGLVFTVVYYAVSRRGQGLMLASLFVLSTAMSVFAGIECAGSSTCDGTQKKCYSKFMNFRLPLFFCPVENDCECQLDTDCPKNQVCYLRKCYADSP